MRICTEILKQKNGIPVVNSVYSRMSTGFTRPGVLFSCLGPPFIWRIPEESYNRRLIRQTISRAVPRDNAAALGIVSVSSTVVLHSQPLFSVRQWPPLSPRAVGFNMCQMFLTVLPSMPFLLMYVSTSSALSLQPAHR